jgi:hypothetical protein
MHGELADDIAQIAAPIYAALLSRLFATHLPNFDLPAATLDAARRDAITQALALRKQVLEWPA